LPKLGKETRMLEDPNPLAEDELIDAAISVLTSRLPSD